MISVIELGRKLREKNKISLKKPVAKLVIINYDQEFLNNVKNVEKYIVEELNVNEIEYLNDEATYITLGIKPNYIFSNGDFDGFFMPIYAEYRYQPISEAGVRGFGNARIGYSPVSKKGMYAHIGGGIIIYQKWELSFGASYQFTRFTESSYNNESYKFDYNLVFVTLSAGYHF